MKKIKTFVSGIMACALLFVCTVGVNAEDIDSFDWDLAIVAPHTGNFETVQKINYSSAKYYAKADSITGDASSKKIRITGVSPQYVVGGYSEITSAGRVNRFKVSPSSDGTIKLKVRISANDGTAYSTGTVATYSLY